MPFLLDKAMKSVERSNSLKEAVKSYEDELKKYEYPSSGISNHVIDSMMTVNSILPAVTCNAADLIKK